MSAACAPLCTGRIYSRRRDHGFAAADIALDQPSCRTRIGGVCLVLHLLFLFG